MQWELDRAYPMRDKWRLLILVIAINLSELHTGIYFVSIPSSVVVCGRFLMSFVVLHLHRLSSSFAVFRRLFAVEKNMD